MPSWAATWKGNMARRKKTLRGQLVDAHHEIRALKSQVYVLEYEKTQAVYPERNRANAAEANAMQTFKAYRAARSRLDEYEKHRRLSDAELVALAALVMSQSLPATDAQRRLVTELEHRQILARAAMPEVPTENGAAP